MGIRKGWIVHLITKEKTSSWSEISPLPKWSRETENETLTQLYAQLAILKTEPIIMGLKRILADNSLLPSVSAGLFSGIYALIRKGPPVVSVPISGLLLGSYEQIQKQIPILLEQGIKHIKLKTRDLSTEQAHFIVKSLKDSVLIRLDINKTWSPKEVNAFLQPYTSTCFDYIEEPGVDPTDFKFPLALDESLREDHELCLDKISNLKALIIKPMLMGVGPRVQTLCKQAQAHRWMICLSSSFETGIGLYQIALFAEFFNIKGYPAGLDTMKFMMDDLVVKQHRIENGQLHFSAISPKKELLKELAYV
ncbi:MAG: hypothetical protein EB051_05030 [Chlamydiia bacterium]|nr:hypothetical protein [Chlamydiia bacterium]